MRPFAGEGSPPLGIPDKNRDKLTYSPGGLIQYHQRRESNSSDTKISVFFYGLINFTTAATIPIATVIIPPNLRRRRYSKS